LFLDDHKVALRLPYTGDKDGGDRERYDIS
jgi:hypothetical protein